MRALAHPVAAVLPPEVPSQQRHRHLSKFGVVYIKGDAYVYILTVPKLLNTGEYTTYQVVGLKNSSTTPNWDSPLEDY